MTTAFIKPTQAMLGLPAERLAQLRALADHHGVTAVEIIERTIRRAIEAKEISDDLPGLCSVEPFFHDFLSVAIRGRELPPLDQLQAHALAVLLCAAAGREPLPGREFKVGSAVSFTLAGGHQVFVGRHVRAVILGLVDGKTGETTLRTATTPSLACDFAALIRKHAKKLPPSLTMITPDGSLAPTNLLCRILNTKTTTSSIPTNEAKQ